MDRRTFLMAAIASGSASLAANYLKRSNYADNTTPKSLSSFQGTINLKQNKNITIKGAASQVKNSMELLYQKQLSSKIAIMPI